MKVAAIRFLISLACFYKGTVRNVFYSIWSSFMFSTEIDVNSYLLLLLLLGQPTTCCCCCQDRLLLVVGVVRKAYYMLLLLSGPPTTCCCCWCCCQDRLLHAAGGWPLPGSALRPRWHDTSIRPAGQFSGRS